jgi:TRAP-type C4-dicarboxylate transport system substrate-binding protein
MLWIAFVRFLFAFAVVVVLGKPAYSAEETVRLVLAHAASEESAAHSLFLKPWAQRLAIVSGGRLEIAIRAAADAGRLYERARDGEVDLIWAPVASLPEPPPSMTVLEQPFLAWPAEATSQAAHGLRHRHDEQEAGPFRVLLLHTDAPLWLHLRDPEGRRADGLAGKRLHVPTSALRRVVERLGAEPVRLDGAAEVARRLASGDLDGSFMSFVDAGPSGVADAAPHHLRFDRPPGARTQRLPGLATAVHVLAINRKRFEALSDDLARLIVDSADQTLAQRTGRAFDKVDLLYRRQQRAPGQIFYRLTDAELERWRNAARTAVAAWKEDVEAAGWDAEALLDEARRLAVGRYVLIGEEIEARTRPTRDKGG